MLTVFGSILGGSFLLCLIVLGVRADGKFFPVLWEFLRPWRKGNTRPPIFDMFDVELTRMERMGIFSTFAIWLFLVILATLAFFAVIYPDDYGMRLVIVGGVAYIVPITSLILFYPRPKTNTKKEQEQIDVV